MKLYHGTTAGGIEILKSASKDREGNPALYLTDNRAYGLFYIRDRAIDFVTCGVGRDGKVYYEERFPSQLEVLYRGVSGFLYEADSEAAPTKAPGIWLCREDTAVVSAEWIPDVYTAIQQEIAQGNVVLCRYEELSQQSIAQYNRGLADMLRRSAFSPQREAFFRQYFPEAWAEAGKKA